MRAFLAGLALLAASQVAAQTPSTVHPGDGPAVVGSAFGAAVALSDTLAAVGAPGQQVSGRDAGALYLYRRSGPSWTEAARLDVDEDDVQLGASVAFGDGFVAAGAVEAGGLAGAVFVARPGGGWALGERIDGPAPRARLGASVAADGDRIAAGAPGVPGAVVYRHDGTAWDTEATLASPDIADESGASVALDGDVLAVGAPARRSPDGVARAGAVDVYRRSGDGWTLETTLVAPDPTADAGFGRAVALDGDRLVIGAPGAETFQGAVYVAQADPAGAWSVRLRLIAPVPAAQQFYGSAVALAGDRMVVGALNDPRSGGHAGRAFVLDWTEAGGWAAVADLAPTKDPAGDNFGSAVALAGPDVWIGAPNAGVPGERRGEAHAYTIGLPTSRPLAPTRPAVEAGPNPTAGRFTLYATTSAPARVRVVVTDVVGRQVAASDHAVGAGRAVLALDLAELAPGVYLWRAAGGVEAAGRVTVAR